jgi:histone H3/H4
MKTAIAPFRELVKKYGREREKVAKLYGEHMAKLWKSCGIGNP